MKALYFNNKLRNISRSAKINLTIIVKKITVPGIMKMTPKKTGIPQPSLVRLCRLYNLMEELEEKKGSTISSKEIGKRLSVGSHNIRKDIGYLDEAGTSGAGYDISKLKASIEKTLGFTNVRNACIIGLGSLGSVIMKYQAMPFPCFKIVAGFDSNINTIETIQSSVPVYPTYDIETIIKKEHIELALLTEPDRNTDKMCERLIKGGIKGIINFTPVMLCSDNESVHIRNIDIITEFMILSALFTLHKQ